MESVGSLFAGSGLTPHGFCLTWDPGLLWLHAGSDVLTFLAYLSIPICLCRLTRGHADLAHRPLGWLFAGFILACGATHAIAVLTLWVPAYWLEGCVKLVTAMLSVVTAVTLWPLVPKLLALPSRDDIEALNAELRARIRQQQRDATALRESQTRLVLAQEVACIGSWDWDVAGLAIHWSAAQYAIYGLTPSAEPMTRAAWLALIDPADRATVRDAYSEATDVGHEYHAEFRVTLPDGSRRWVADRGLVIADGSLRVVGVSSDVTDRRHLTEHNQILSAQLDQDAYARALATEQLRVLFDHSPDSLFVVHVIASEHGDPETASFVFETINPAAERLSGRAVVEYVGRSPEQTHGPEQARELVEQFRRCLSDDATVTVAARRCLGGRERQFETLLAPVRDPRTGRITRIIGASRDVTERAALEQQLRHVAKIEATNRLTAGIAHDFNNLLQALMGGLEMLILDYDEPGSREYAAVALDAARRGAELTHRLLAFSRQQALRPRPAEARRLLTGVADLLSRSIDPDVALVVAAVDDVVMLVDPAELEAALINLVVNAVDAMPDGGRVDLTVAAASPAPELDLPGTAYAVVSVRDQGCGMPAEVLRQACEPFFTTKGPHGSGLGLSMVQGFARQSGGDLRIRSAPGQGTQVEIWLPLANLPAAGEAAHLLLVDDMADVRITVESFLRHAGFVVTSAASGREALRCLRDGLRCDAMVTDYSMPHLNGIDLLGAARALRPGLPALIITGFDDTAMRAREVGARVLQKPFSRRALVDEVRSLLHAEAAAGPPRLVALR